MIKTLLPLITFFLLNTVIFAQTENRTLIGHYPLQGDLMDITGNNQDLTISQIDVRDTALYSDGANSFSDTANRISGFFPELSFDDLAFSLEFSLDSIPGDNLSRSIIIGGSGWRWLSARYNQISKKITFGYNNSFSARDAFDFDYNTWYEVTISYQRSNQLGRMFINGQEIARDTFDLTHGNDKNLLLDCFCGAHAMRGLWRNLKVYGVDTINTPTVLPLDITCSLEQGVSSPDTNDGRITVNMSGGTMPYEVILTIDGVETLKTTDSSAVIFENLGPGNYSIEASDQSGQLSNCTLELLAAPTLTLQCLINRNITDSVATDGQIKIEISDGQPSFNISVEHQGTMNFMTDSTTLLLENLAMGSHVITVTDQEGKTESCHVDLLPPQTDLKLLSHYPLLTDVKDILGIHADLSTTNVPLIENEGLFAEGLSNTLDTFNQIQTQLRDIDVHNFYISLEIKLDSITDSPVSGKRDIFVAGLSWRWIAPVYHQSSKTFGLNYNNWKDAQDTDAPFDFDRWYEVAVSYDTVSKIALMFLDRQEIARDTVVLETNNDKSFGLWCNCGPKTMRGFWRNFKIYAPADSMITPTIDFQVESVQLYPNPVENFLNIKLMEEQGLANNIRIFRPDGSLILQVPLSALRTEYQINTATWFKGVYFIRIGSTVRSIVKI